MGKYAKLLAESTPQASQKASGGGSTKYARLLAAGAAADGGGGGGGSVGGFFKKTVGTVLGSEPVRRALDVIDTPRAAVTSLVKEGVDLAQGEGFSPRDLARQTKDNYGFGELLEDEAGSLPLNVKRALGFVGDVTADPLTWLTFGASAAAGSGLKQGARLSYKHVAGRALDQGLDDVADQVLRQRSAALLDDATKQALGVKTTPRFGVGKAKVDVPFLDPVSRLRASITEPTIGRAANSQLVQGIRQNIDPLGKSFAELRRRKPAVAMAIERVERATRYEGDGVRDRALRELDEVFQRYGDGVDRDAVRQLIEDGVARRAAKGTPEGTAARALGIWFERQRRLAQRVSGRTIPKLEDYLPHQMTREFRELLDEAGAGGRRGVGGGREAFEARREYREGKLWFGEELTTGSLDEMEAIARKHLGDNYVQVFRSDPWEIAQAYARSIGQMAANHKFLGVLQDRGLTRHFDADGLKAAEAYGKKLGRKAAKGRKNADQLSKAASKKTREAKNLRAAAPAGVDPNLQAQIDRAGMEARDAEGVLGMLDDEGGMLAGQLDEPAPVVDDAALVAAQDGLSAAERELAELQAAPPPQPKPKAKPKAKKPVKPKADPKAREQLARAKKIRSELDAIEKKRIELTTTAAAAAKQAEQGEAELLRALDPKAAGFKPEDAVAALRAHGDPKLATRADEIEELVDELASAPRAERRGLMQDIAEEVRKARQAVIGLDEAARKGGLRKAKDYVKASDLTGPGDVAPNRPLSQRGQDADKVFRSGVRGQARLAADGDTVVEIAKLDNRAAKLQAELDELVRLGVDDAPVGAVADDVVEEVVEEIPEVVEQAAPAVDPQVLSAAEKKVAQARQAVDKAQTEFDAQRAAAEGWEAHVTEVQDRLADIEAEYERVSARRQAALDEQATLLREADKLAKAAERETDRNLRRAARLESVAATQRAKARELRREAKSSEAMLAELRLPERQAEWAAIQAQGLLTEVASHPDRWADPQVAKAIAEIGEKSTPAQVGKFIRSYDKMLARWKAYALLSPGFHVRNDLGAHWNNWMADVDRGVERNFIRALHHYKKDGAARVAEKMGAEWERVFAEADRMSVWGADNVTDLSDVGAAGSRGAVRTIADKAGIDLGKGVDKLDPSSMNFTPLQWNLKVGSMVERRARGVLFADRLLKGFTPEEALQDVVKYHFDYSELSRMEKEWGKRIFPFYTWTRKNFPLQLENYVRNPHKFNRFLAAKRNVELGVEEHEGKPDYLNDIMAIATPFKMGGNPVFVTPDLPINRMGEGPTDQAMNSLTPAIKLPMELQFNQSVFTGFPLRVRGEEAAEVPGVYRPIAPILYQLDGLLGLPKVERRDGKYVMLRREAYKLDQALPIGGRGRRVLPTEDKYKQRHATTLLSQGLGVNARTLTPDMIASEMIRRRGGS